MSKGGPSRPTARLEQQKRVDTLVNVRHGRGLSWTERGRKRKTGSVLVFIIINMIGHASDKP